MGGGILERVEKIKNDLFYLKCLSLNDLKERGRQFCRHDYQHMVLVSEISYKMIMEDQGMERFIINEGLTGFSQARDIIYAAGLLHDIGRWRQYENGDDHALAGADMSIAVLERAGFTPKEIQITTRAIGEHRRAGPGASYLGRVLCLADDLSRPCPTCQARPECYKAESMDSIREKNTVGLCPDVG